jgi:cation diffusion facilitator family transporter
MVMHSHNLAEHQHDHSFGMDRRRRAESRTMIVVVLTLVTMVVEVTAGLAFGSMALLADGIHMASHAAALGIGVAVYVMARRLAGSPRFSFGSGKLNALGGYSSALMLAAFALIMAYESTARLLVPVPIRFDFAILVAVVGLIVNGVSIVLLNAGHEEHDHHHGHDHGHDHRHDHGDHNLRGAFLHVVADAMTSVLAIVALLFGKYMGLVWLDPVMGLVGAGVILWWSAGLIRASSGVLLDRQGPAPLCDEIRKRVEAVGDSKVADLHLWSVGPNIFAAELVVVSHSPAAAEAYREQLKDLKLAHLVVETRVCPGPAC